MSRPRPPRRKRARTPGGRGIWQSGEDYYDPLGMSQHLRKNGAPFIEGLLRPGGSNESGLNTDRPVLADFGCWSGRHLPLLERIGRRPGERSARHRVHGIDEPFAARRVREARATYPGFNISDSGIRNTGLATSSVDAAISWRVLHNLTEVGALDEALTEIRRVLKHGAPLVVAVRAALKWMNAPGPYPVIRRSHNAAVGRDDLYFSVPACERTFRLYGFEIKMLEPIEEKEVIHGRKAENSYWHCHFVLDKETPIGASPTEDKSKRDKLVDVEVDDTRWDQKTKLPRYGDGGQAGIDEQP